MYGRLSDGRLEYFKGYIINGGIVTANPKTEAILAAGYKPVEFGEFPSDCEPESVTAHITEYKHKIKLTYKVPNGGATG